MLHRVQVTDTSEHQLFRGDNANQAFMVELLQRTSTKGHQYEEDTFLGRWKSVLWSDESKFQIFGSTHRVFVRHRVGERMVSTCVVSTMKHEGGGVMVLCW